MPGPGERVRRVAAELRQGEHFAEKDFYLEEFRGRSVLVAVAPGVTDLGRLASALADLVRNDTRVLLCWSDLTPAAQRRLRAALGGVKGLGRRRALLVAVREALHAGVDSVNLCTPEGIADELFTYEGSGTLFTRGDYCRVAPLGLDDFAQAERLLERGQREGLLKLRSPDEIAEVLAVGFGATICDRHLAGIAGLLTAPYAAERAGEIVGLYTITRFTGEGIGERLVARLLAEAVERRLAYVFACAVDERAVQFFLRLGFEQVGAERVPVAKWAGYDVRRRTRVVVCKRQLDAGRG